MTIPVTLREATLADAGGIAQVHVESWRTTYPGIMPQEHLDALSITEREQKWQGILSPGNADVTYTFVAETEEGEIVGFTEGGRDRNGGPASQAEIYVLYLLKSQQGRGIGRRLLQTAARRLHAAGYSTLFLWVSALNHPACRFYEAVGGVPVRTGQRTNQGITYDDIGYGWNKAALLRLIEENSC